MATDSRALPSFFNTDADFQAYCQGIAAQLVVAGMVKTTDTGQINNATVTKPTVANTAQGYEIYKFSDGLQATVPIFFKIEYGCATAADQPSCWITVGTSTNGAGTIINNTTRQQCKMGNVSTSAGSTLTSYCSGDGSRVGICINYDGTNVNRAFGFIIDRMRDATNATTSEGCGLATGSSQANWTQAILGGAPTTGSASVAFSGNCASGTLPHGAGARTYGVNVLTAALGVAVGQMRYMLQGVIANKNDVAAGSQFSATNLGGAHNYIMLTNWNPLFTNDSTNDRMAMLWE